MPLANQSEAGREFRDDAAYWEGHHAYKDGQPADAPRNLSMRSQLRWLDGWSDAKSDAGIAKALNG